MMNAVALQRSLGITTVGLDLRDELLLKSLLRIANEETQDKWQFRDDMRADVALCAPASASSIPVDKVGDGSAPPRCIWVLRDGERKPAGTASLSAPFRVAELRHLLDEVSNLLRLKRTSGTPISAPPSFAGSSNVSPLHPFKPFRFGLALNKLMERASREVHRLEVGRIVLHVIPAARALLLTEPLDEGAVGILLEPRVDVRISRVDEKEAQRLISEGAKPQTIDWLLWRAGLDGPGNQLLPGLSEHSQFALKRWPDFGRLKHKQSHFLMAGLLTRAAHSIDELALASAQPVAEAYSFINACALCDLIEVRPVAVKAVARAASPTAERTTRYGDVFRSIRTVLGFRR